MLNDTRILETERIGNVLVVSPLTDLGELEYARIKAEASGVLRLFELTQVNNVVLDLARADYSGSSAIGFFLELWKKVQSRGGSMALCHVSRHEHEILRACHLETLWPICESRDAALAAIRGEGKPITECDS